MDKSSSCLVSPDEIIKFWFEELSPSDWFRKSEALDQHIAERFSDALSAAAAGDLSHWRESPSGRLAEIIVLDQFSRNIHRDSAQAFENDAAALACAKEAIKQGADQQLTAQQNAFLYMPFMHSETAADHDTALALYESIGLKTHLDAERKHQAIIKRFGRYPHRNALLGRESTDEESAFLNEPGSSF
ncbi:MAG: DUF924 domain-containing protein [Salinisphaera sp.]|jgi:uncharacterized protein (DUF924 family)|nr:DUF924 domain-containing protein [Salinisphaera sp.]